MTKKYDPNLMPFASLQYVGKLSYLKNGGQHYQNYRQKTLKMIKEEKTLSDWKLLTIDFMTSLSNNAFKDFVLKYKDKFAYMIDGSYLTYRIKFKESNAIVFHFAGLEQLDRETKELVYAAVSDEFINYTRLERFGGIYEINDNTPEEVMKILGIYLERSQFIPVEVSGFLSEFAMGGISMKYKDFCKYVEFVRANKCFSEQTMANIEEAYFNAVNAKYPPNAEVYYFMRTNREGSVVLIRDTKKSPKKEKPSAPAQK